MFNDNPFMPAPPFGFPLNREALMQKIEDDGDVIVEAGFPMSFEGAVVRLKSWTHLFQAIKSGAKKHDIRSMKDRHHYVGQVLNLEEFDHTTGKYTGDSVLCRVTYITSNATPCAFSSAVLDRDYCILSLELIDA